MFEGSLVESTPLLRTHNRWPALASIAAQAALVAVFLAIPLLHPEALVFTNKLIRLAPPALRPTPPPPPPRPIHVAASSASAPSLAPPTQAVHIQRPSPNTDATPVANALPFGEHGSPRDLPFDFADGNNSSGTSPHVVVATGSGSSIAHGPLRLSTGVTTGLLLAPIVPVYPPIARISHTEGIVIVQAVISKSGHIESAHAISGPTLLQRAAIEAVQQARYRPYLLNGQPTEVETTITINFKLGS